MPAASNFLPSDHALLEYSRSTPIPTAIVAGLIRLSRPIIYLTSFKFSPASNSVSVARLVCTLSDVKFSCTPLKPLNKISYSAVSDVFKKSASVFATSS